MIPNRKDIEAIDDTMDTIGEAGCCLWKLSMLLTNVILIVIGLAIVWTIIRSCSGS